MRLCGIISRFQLLSPSIGQVTHALLTRPPLSDPNEFHQEQAQSGLREDHSVRLACVKHAASVYPEPGSNSQNVIYEVYAGLRLSNRKSLLFKVCIRSNLYKAKPYHR